MTKGQIYVANETFFADVDGAPTLFTKDKTRVREGHEVYQRAPHLFDPVDAHYEVEDASAVPGSKRAR